MLKLEFNFGLELDREGKKLTSSEQALGVDSIRRTALALFGGCTLTETKGDWLDLKTGKTYSETGSMLSILVDEPPSQTDVQIMANVIKKSLNQKGVYLTTYPVKSVLL